MSGEIAAAGDIMTGALTARAVEPHAGEAHGPGGALCLNCGTKLIGEHCHRCGQSGHVHRTVGAIGHELLHGVFHFEGKVWRTLPMLFFRPGELTRRYIAGERARFVSPLALFLLSVFFMFAVLSNLPGTGLGDIGKAFDGADMDRVRANLADERLKVRADLKGKQDAIAKEDAQPVVDGPRLARLREDVAKLRANDARLAQAQRFLPAPDGTSAAQFNSSNGWLNEKWRYAKDNPKLLIYKLKTSAYKYSWALIPISLPFVWLLFPFRRGVGMYDHAVFTTYSLSFMSLFLVTITTLEAAGVGDQIIGWALLLIPPLHIYKQLKGAYRLRRIGALARTALLLFFTAITSTIFVVLLMFLGTLD